MSAQAHLTWTTLRSTISIGGTVRLIRPLPRRVRGTVPTVVLVPLLATALASGALSDAHGKEAPRSGPRPRPPVPAPVFTDRAKVRLITGESVHLLSRADGTMTASVSGRTPFIWSGEPAARYVVPKDRAARMPALDLSLFNVSALALVSREGRTPVVIRLAPGRPATQLTGLHVDVDSARTVGRSTVVHATYGPHFAGLDAADLSGIASVRLDAPRTQHPSRADVPTHTVQVHVARHNGSAADYAMVTLQATVDGDSYLEQADIDGLGMATFTDVPEGEYSVVVQTFEKVLVDRQLDVTADRTVEFDLADATVKPRVTLGDHRTLWTDLTVERDPEQGFGIPFGYAGPHFSMRVRPSSGNVAHGALHTAVTATFVRGREADGYDSVAVTADVKRGIPEALTFVHHRRDFARVVDVFYANGPAAPRPLMLIPGSTHVDLFGGETMFMTPVPGRLHVWVQAGPGSYLQQTLFPLAPDVFEGDNTQVGDVRAYPKAQQHAPISFLHGPVGPGLEVPPRSRFTSGAWRWHDQLELSVPLFGGSGAASFDFADPRDASWSLRQATHVLAHGHQSIYRAVEVPHGPRVYTLTAQTHPGRAWDLSTQVRDVWTFHSQGGRRGVPLLTPSYVPPTDLAGNVRPGHTGYRLSFHSTPHSARVARVSVEVSTNHGRTWHPARVTRTSGLTFHVGYRTPPAHGKVHYLSLRVTARDVAGNSVQETAFHAYRLM